jgi:threonylcarbamoyladenosine tRNA methylthiotransferase MtaB
MKASPYRLVILMSNESPSIRHRAPTAVCLLTLGCKLNQADSEAIARDLLAAGCQVVDRPAPAGAFVINTCSVTHVADRKARHLARLARRLSPGAPVIVTGCYVETAGPGLRAAMNADLVLGNDQKPSLAARLARLGAGQSGWDADPAPRFDPTSPLRTRAFLKVQEGCNDVCAFCVVPRTRGRERSVPVEEVVGAVRAREEEGVQEVVLTGTQLGAYRPALGTDSSIATAGSGPGVLLQALLAETAVPRLRLSSLQPQDITPELLSLWEDARLCRHFHLALQSASDSVLSRMRRRYTTLDYRRALALIRKHVPDAAVTTDVMVGFPGESEADFEGTYTFCREAAFAGLHVFPYSRRPGTGAARPPLADDQVREPVKRERAHRLLALGSDLQAGFEGRFRGRVMPVLWERARPSKGGLVWEGLTDNYIRVFTHSDADLWNRILPAWLGDAAGSTELASRRAGPGKVEGGVWGDLIGTPRAHQACLAGRRACLSARQV